MSKNLNNWSLVNREGARISAGLTDTVLDKPFRADVYHIPPERINLSQKYKVNMVCIVPLDAYPPLTLCASWYADTAHSYAYTGAVSRDSSRCGTSVLANSRLVLTGDTSR